MNTVGKILLLSCITHADYRTALNINASFYMYMMDSSRKLYGKSLDHLTCTNILSWILMSLLRDFAYQSRDEEPSTIYSLKSHRLHTSIRTNNDFRRGTEDGAAIDQLPLYGFICAVDK